MAGRVRWVMAGGLLVAAGGLTLVATTRHWARCRPNTAAPGCRALEQATTGLPSWSPIAYRDTETVVLTAVAGLLLCLAWVLVAGWARRRWMWTLVATIIGVQPLLGAVLGVLDVVTADRYLPLASSGWLTWPAEMLVLPLLLGAGWILEERPIETVRLIIIGWGVTSFGSMHVFGDYVILMAAHPDRHPGTVGNPAGLGVGIAATQLATGVIVVIISLLVDRGPRRGDGDRRGRDGFTLAA